MHPSTSRVVLNYMYVVGISTLLGAIVAVGMGRPVPWQAFAGATGLAVCSLQCASGRGLLRECAEVVRALVRAGDDQ